MKDWHQNAQCWKYRLTVIDPAIFLFFLFFIFPASMCTFQTGKCMRWGSERVNMLEIWSQFWTFLVVVGGGGGVGVGVGVAGRFTVAASRNALIGLRDSLWVDHWWRYIVFQIVSRRSISSMRERSRLSERWWMKWKWKNTRERKLGGRERQTQTDRQTDRGRER